MMLSAKNEYFCAPLMLLEMTCASTEDYNGVFAEHKLIFIFLNTILVISSGHHSLASRFVGFIICTTKEWIRSFLARLDNEIPITTAVTL